MKRIIFNFSMCTLASLALSDGNYFSGLSHWVAFTYFSVALFLSAHGKVKVNFKSVWHGFVAAVIMFAWLSFSLVVVVVENFITIKHLF